MSLSNVYSLMKVTLRVIRAHLDHAGAVVLVCSLMEQFAPLSFVKHRSVICYFYFALAAG